MARSVSRRPRSTTLASAVLRGMIWRLRRPSPGVPRMSLVLPLPPTREVPVKGAPDDSFPVHRIYCVGRNYVEHAKEMGFTGREPPFFFMKPADAVVPVAEGETGRIAYPSLTKNLHHEVELVVAIGTRRARHRRGRRAGPRLGLCRRPRHDAPRPAGRDEEAGPALGHRQGLRPFGADRPDRAQRRSAGSTAARRSRSRSTASCASRARSAS